MTQPKMFVVVVSVFGLLTMIPTLVSAEWFIDLYAGAASSQDADVDVERDTGLFFSARTISTTETVSFDTSFTLGGRGGYWFESTPWLGLALDLSFFQPEAEAVDITVVPLSALLMLRWPLLTSDDFPKGKLQPYVGVGPSLFFSEISADFRPTLPEKASETSVEIGLDARAGLAWQFLRHLAIFGEYRFTHTSIDAQTKSEFLVAFSSPTTTIETTLDTHHFLIGVSIRF